MAVMLEGTASELSDDKVLNAIKNGLEEVLIDIIDICNIHDSRSKSILSGLKSPVNLFQAQNVAKAVDEFGHQYGKTKMNVNFYTLDQNIKEEAYK